MTVASLETRALGVELSLAIGRRDPPVRAHFCHLAVRIHLEGVLVTGGRIGALAVRRVVERCGVLPTTHAAGGERSRKRADEAGERSSKARMGRALRRVTGYGQSGQ